MVVEQREFLSEKRGKEEDERERSKTEKEKKY